MCFYIVNLAWLKCPEVRDRVTGLKPSGDGSHSRPSSASLSNSKRRCFYNVMRSAPEVSAAADSYNSAAVPTTTSSTNSTNESPMRSMGEVLQQMQQQAQAMMQEFKSAASEAHLARAETSAGAASNSSSGTIMSISSAS